MSDAKPAITIPDDLKACQALIEELAGTIGEQADKIEELHRQKEEYRLAYKELLQRAFRRRSERYLHDPRQMAFDFGDSDEACDAAEGLAEAVEESLATRSCRITFRVTRWWPKCRTRSRNVQSTAHAS